jgi:hypothetical protein
MSSLRSTISSMVNQEIQNAEIQSSLCFDERFKTGTYQSKRVGMLRKCRLVYHLFNGFYTLLGRLDKDNKMIEISNFPEEYIKEGERIIDGEIEDYDFENPLELEKEPEAKTGFRLFNEGVSYCVKYHNESTPHLRNILVEKVFEDYMMVRENNRIKKFYLSKTEYLTPGDLEYLITIELDTMKKFGLGESSIRVSEYPTEFTKMGYFSFQHKGKLYCIPNNLITFKKKVYEY